MQQKGITLIELMVTLAVAAILFTVATPSFTAMIKENRAASEQRSLMSIISAARSEASHRNQRITIASVTDDWSNGFKVFVDDGDSIYTAANDELIKDISASADGISIGAGAVGSLAKSISFNGDGTLNGATSFVFTICDDRGASEGYQLTLNFIGRSRASTPAACLISP